MVGRITKALTNYHDPRSFGSRLRARRIRPLTEMIEEVRSLKGSVRIIDVGGTEAYWRILPTDYLAERDVTITLVNMPGEVVPSRSAVFDYLEADGCDLESIEAGCYDIAHSNSVIEHVGDWNRMVAFAKEVARVAPRYFVQTPNYWFPMEPHFMSPFFHWLPIGTRARLLRAMPLGAWERATSEAESLRAVSSIRLLRREELQELFPTASIETERVAGLPKSLIAIKCK